MQLRSFNFTIPSYGDVRSSTLIHFIVNLGYFCFEVYYEKGKHKRPCQSSTIIQTHWPLVYAVDMACDVVAHLETREPAMTRQMWGERRGCFEKPQSGVNPTVSRPNNEMYYILIVN